MNCFSALYAIYPPPPIKPLQDARKIRGFFEHLVPLGSWAIFKNRGPALFKKNFSIFVFRIGNGKTHFATFLLECVKVKNLEIFTHVVFIFFCKKS